MKKNLRYLALNSNQIGDTGAEAFAQALEQNISLRKLWLGWNRIGCTGAVALVRALKKNTSLSLLFLDNYDLFEDSRILGLKELINGTKRSN